MSEQLTFAALTPARELPVMTRAPVSKPLADVLAFLDAIAAGESAQWGGLIVTRARADQEVNPEHVSYQYRELPGAPLHRGIGWRENVAQWLLREKVPA